MSIMRTYYIWQVATSSDKSYMIAAWGLCSDAEFSVGIIVGCFPVMPRFFQHFGPKLSGVFSFWSRSASTSGQAAKSNTKPKTDTAIKIKKSFAKYRIGTSVLGSCNDPHSHFYGDFLTLNESVPSQLPEKASVALIQVSDAGVATRRDDLEYGHQRSQDVG